jgi:flagellar basal-body rod protein FlgB
MPVCGTSIAKYRLGTFNSWRMAISLTVSCKYLRGTRQVSGVNMAGNTPVGSVTNLNSYLGIHPAGLKVSAQRTELLARNLANADTPNYKSRDIDFRSALAQAGSKDAPVSMTATNARHIAIGSVAEGGQPQLKYRVPLAPSLDGNTVDAQLEQAAFSENAVRYQASLTFLGAKFRSLMTAITGQ